ncbi:hypothetical protein AG1IA_09497 [Rhizoctonia solani AG-1 IA]|uniref:Uncharacterized protein n=1 Tax=Thanatephorus cucumeris (strain AG1-IA) TaxID=983506 RepID=L8WET5_THACA|nr:hypothetical protein AG1IA_09497 [Rhizoctonia solani AG-1 IA]
MATLFENVASIDDLLSAWSKSGPSDEEVIAYATAAIEQLGDSQMQNQFAENVRQAGVWANEVDKAFDKVTRSFADMNTRYGKDFPGFGNYNTQWIEYNQRWITLLDDSRRVASQNVAILRRFDQVFLHMVEQVQTAQDREDCIIELQSFIDEDHEDSTKMYQGFLGLKRDIEDFVRRMDRFIEETGSKIAEDIKALTQQIKDLEDEITIIAIKDAQTALVATGVLLNIIGIIVSGSVLASYQADRRTKAADLADKQRKLEDANRKQQGLAHLKTEYDGLKPKRSVSNVPQRWNECADQPGELLFCVSQSDYFANSGVFVSIQRFKAELRLARDTCGPLQEGLERYATELANRK